MKNFANAMANEIAYHRKACVLGDIFNSSANIANAFIWCNLANTCPQTFMSYLYEFASFRTWVANQKHLGSVAVKSTQNRRNIDIHDVTVFKNFIFARNAVAYHFIDARADRF